VSRRLTAFRRVWLTLATIALLGSSGFATTPVLAARGDSAGIAISLPTGLRVSGRITNSLGSGIAGAFVGVCETWDSCAWGAETADDGTYTVRGVLAGSYLVSVYPPNDSPYLQGWYTPSGTVQDPNDAATIVVGSSNITGIDLEMSEGFSISGVLTGSTSAAIPDAQVYISGSPGYGSAMTDGAGAFEIRGVLAGTYSLEVRVPEGLDFVSGPVLNGTVTESDASTFSVSGDITGMDVQAPLGLRLAGTLTGPEAATARVEAFGTNHSRGAPVAANGSWTVGGLWPDQYQLVFTPPESFEGGGFALGYWANASTLTYDFNAAAFVDLTTSDVTGLDAAIPTGVSISGVVTNASGRPLPRAFVQACGDAAIGCAFLPVGSDGSWRIAHAVPGNYTVAVSEPEHVNGWYGPGGYAATEPAATVLHLAGSNIAGVHVVLPTGYEISGRVTGPGGVPVAGAFVLALAGGGIAEHGPGGDVTGPDGSFHLRGLTAGLYAVQVSTEPPTDYQPGYYDATAATGYTADFAKRTQVAVPAIGASFVPITPKRVVALTTLAANAPQTFSVAGVAPIPAGATAVTGIVTVIGPTGAGDVAITPTPTSAPTTSAISVATGDTRSNNFTLKLGSGKLSAVFRASAGKTAQIVIDITGYFLPGSTHATYSLLGSVRVMDTRAAPLRVGPLGRFSAKVSQTLSVAGANGIPADAVAITGTIRVVGPTAAGSLTVTPAVPSGTPTTATLTFPAGESRANGLTAALNSSGDLTITYNAGTGNKADVTLEVTGYYRNNPSGLLFYPVAPARIVDSRPGSVGSALSGVFRSGIPRTMLVARSWEAPVGAKAITGNLTVVNQSAAGSVAITAVPTATPSYATLAFPFGGARANGVTTPLGTTGRMSFVYKATAGATTHLLLDLTGFFN